MKIITYPLNKKIDDTEFLNTYFPEYVSQDMVNYGDKILKYQYIEKQPAPVIIHNIEKNKKFYDSLFDKSMDREDKYVNTQVYAKIIYLNFIILKRKHESESNTILKIIADLNKKQNSMTKMHSQTNNMSSSVAANQILSRMSNNKTRKSQPKYNPSDINPELYVLPEHIKNNENYPLLKRTDKMQIRSIRRLLKRPERKHLVLNRPIILKPPTQIQDLRQLSTLADPSTWANDNISLNFKLVLPSEKKAQNEKNKTRKSPSQKSLSNAQKKGQSKSQKIIESRRAFR